MLDKKMSILIVDDFQSMRTQIREILKDMKFECFYEARDGLEAAALLEAEKIDFIISDVHMPKSSGMDLLHYVRGHEKFKDLPFLMVTGVSDKKNVIEAVAAKVSNYVVKPFSPQILEERIRAIFGCAEPLWKKM